MSESSVEYVARRIETEKAELREALARLDKASPKLTREYDKAWAKYMATPDGHAKAEEFGVAAEQAGRLLHLNMDEAGRTRAALLKLDDPAEVARRVDVREQLATLKARKENDMPAKKNKTVKTEVSQEIVDRIVADIDSGLGLTTVANKLNDDKVKTPGKSEVWYPQVVRGIYMKATGAKGIRDVRKNAPLASRAVADTPAAKTEKAEPKNGNGKTSVKDAAEAAATKEVTPDPKPTRKPRAPRKATPKKATAKATA